MNRPFAILLTILTLSAFSAHAQDAPRPDGFKPDDRVVFDVASEDWVTTKTARVAITMEAAVTSGTAGGIRADMMKAVNDLAKADWRLTSFDRNQDQTGMERWSAGLEARLPENALSGLGDTAKKLSKAGMQITVASIDFSPTLEETEAVRGTLRAQVYKIANEQLAVLNAAIPGRNYRIATINFTSDDDTRQMPHVIKGRVAVAMVVPTGSPAETTSSASMERAEKVSLTARIVYAALPAETKAPVPAASPASSPADIKH